MSVPKLCWRGGCGKRGARRFEWKTPEGELVYAYLCPACCVIAKQYRQTVNLLRVLKQRAAKRDTVVELSERRTAQRDSEPDKEPA